MNPIQPDFSNTPMGAALGQGGASFRIWAPRAKDVYVSGDFNGWTQNDACRLTPIAGGHWAGFVPHLADGEAFLYYINGLGSSGYKRDPRARLLTREPPFPASNCVLRDPSQFPWHDAGFRPPEFSDLIVYQLHVGAFSPAPGSPHGKFLDIIEKLPYLSALGVNAIEPLPVVEYPTTYSLGYNGTDYYSPEDDYCVGEDASLAQYLTTINALLASRGMPLYAAIDVLRSADNQLRAMIDLCHVFGIAVILDVVYNHAGGGFDENSMWFLDRMPEDNKNDSLYFTDHDWAGGQVFAYWNNDVQQFLIDNARSFYDEYHADGFRFDEVSVMDRNGGWGVCQAITGTLRYVKPQAIQIAEYWPVNPAVTSPASLGGAGFDATWHDGLRGAVRAVVAQSSAGASASIDMDSIANAIANPGLQNRWRAVQCVENHDIVREGRDPRIPLLADGFDPRSWYARSRSRVATGLLLTSLGIPMLFMGEEFLESKPWNDTPGPENQISWNDLDSGNKTLADFLRCTSGLVALRRRLPGLRGEGIHIIHVHNGNRVIVFQRWVEGQGNDVIIAATLSETTHYNYQVGFPADGYWFEVFNSDVYDNWVNPIVAGNAGSVYASSPGMHGLPASASLTIPANGLVVFARNP